MSRGRQPTITPKQAAELLQRVEERGESIASLANEVHVSVRTLERAIQRARERRDQSRATNQFLTDRLTRHHDALVSFADELRTELAKHTPGPASPSFKANSLWEALRQHLPQSFLWRDLNDWEKLGPVRENIIVKLRQTILDKVVTATGKTVAPSEGDLGLRSYISDDLFFDLEVLAYHGTRPERSFSEEPHPEGVLVKRGAYGLAVLKDKKETEEFKKTYQRVVAAAPGWPQFKALKTAAEQEQRLRGNLTRNLTGIVLKGMVPGKCRYCPF